MAARWHAWCGTAGVGCSVGHAGPGVASFIPRQLVCIWSYVVQRAVIMHCRIHHHHVSLSVKLSEKEQLMGFEPTTTCMAYVVVSTISGLRCCDIVDLGL